MRPERTEYFNSFNTYLKKRFSGRIAKLSLDLGIPCPHRAANPPGCIFCKPNVIMPIEKLLAGKIAKQMEVCIAKVGKRYDCKQFLAYFQHETNTAGDPIWLKEQFQIAAEHPQVAGIIISTRPDCIDKKVLDIMTPISKSKPVWLELGLQSIHNSTLKLINRGHDYRQFKEALKMATSRDLPICVHVILGLPGEDYSMMEQTFRKLATLPIDSIKIHHLQVYQGAPLEKLWREGKIETFKNIDEYIPLVTDMLELLPWRIKIQRIVADSPKNVLLAPKWDLNKNVIIEKLEKEFRRRGTVQGSRSEESA